MHRERKGSFGPGELEAFLRELDLQAALHPQLPSPGHKTRLPLTGGGSSLPPALRSTLVSRLFHSTEAKDLKSFDCQDV